MRAVALAGLALLYSATAAAETDTLTRTLEVIAPGEVFVTLSAGCAHCDWGLAGREAVALRVVVDGRYSQHLLLTRGDEPAPYTIALGALEDGRHQLEITRDRALSARDAGVATIDVSRVDTLVDGQTPGHLAAALAPILYARPNTVGKFTDVPVFMWYETTPTARGTRFQYSVIFTNEDGGTQTDRLMATWGRTTDIEYVYSVEVDRKGAILAEDYQGPDHQVLPFRGRRDARHPLLWVATDNNMVKDSGETAIRYALEPVAFDLTNRSREAVMDTYPWLYAVASREMAREGKIAANARPRTNTIPDPRQFVYVEACAEVGTAAVAFAVRVDETWIPSDLDIPEYRIVRDGCFRGAVPLPAGMDGRNVKALRVLAYERPPRNGAPAPAANPVTLTRVNTVFTLTSGYVPQPLSLEWRGRQTIAPGARFELPIAAPRPLD